MARTSLDVLRSVKKYIAELALPDYEVRLSSEEGAWERPFCRVAWTTPISLNPHGARILECRRTMQVVAWPEESKSPDRARIAAEELTERLVLAFSVGLHEPSYNLSTRRAHPLRIPIWDYAGVAWNKPATTRGERDFASVPEPPDIGDIEDPDTDTSRLVVGSIRLRWLRDISVTEGGEEVEEVTVTFPP